MTLSVSRLLDLAALIERRNALRNELTRIDIELKAAGIDLSEDEDLDVLTQCAAMATGGRCRLLARPGSEFCRAHKDSPKKIFNAANRATVWQCAYIMARGTRCPRASLENEKYCPQHAAWQLVLGGPRQ